MRVKWVDFVHSINVSGREPLFSDLTKFVEEKPRVAISVYGLDLAKEQAQSKGLSKTSKSGHKSKEKVTTLTTYIKGKSTNFEQKCCCFQETCRDLALCLKFKSMKLGNRYDVVHKCKLCYNAFS